MGVVGGVCSDTLFLSVAWVVVMASIQHRVKHTAIFRCFSKAPSDALVLAQLHSDLSSDCLPLSALVLSSCRTA